MESWSVILKKICLATNRIFPKPPNPGGRESTDAYAEVEFQKAPGVVEMFGPHGDIRGKHILDIGCGMGGVSTYFALNGAKWVVAIDYDEKRVATARAYANKKGAQNISFEVCDASSLPYERDEFDMIMMTSVVEHLPDPEAVFKECYRVLKKGGTVNLNFPPYYSPLGAHLYDYVYMPWCHLFFPERVLVDVWKESYAKDYESGKNRLESFSPADIDGVTTISELAGLNKMTISNYKKLVARKGFKIIEFRYSDMRRRYVLPCSIFPFLREFLISYVTSVLQK